MKSSDIRLPKFCEVCKSIGTFEFQALDRDGMTEGQEADAEAFDQGVAVCSKCGHEVDIGF